MTSEEDPLDIVGTTIDDKYRVVELAGEGGFATVYRAEHLIWQEPIALKFFTLLKNADTSVREHLLDDFIQEGKLLSQLSSRSTAIVQARDIGKLKLAGDVWVPYMVLEWLEGDSLDQVLLDEEFHGLPPRTLQEAMTLCDPVAEAVDVAHDAKVAHRDLKPANILIVGDARDSGVVVKVLDFGIAKVMAEHQELQEQLKQTGHNLTAFTPQYGAPEQFSRRFGATGPWTDVYAMALIVIELLRGGRCVLDGDSLFELGEQSANPEVRPTPRNLGIELGDEAERVFAKALAVRPEDRYPTMGAFWSELHLCVDTGDRWPRKGRASRRSAAARSAEPSGALARDRTPSSDSTGFAPTIPLSDSQPDGQPTSAAPGSPPAGSTGPAVTAEPTVATAPVLAGKSQSRAMLVWAMAGAAVVAAASFVWLRGDDRATPPPDASAVSASTASAPPAAPLTAEPSAPLPAPASATATAMASAAPSAPPATFVRPPAATSAGTATPSSQPSAPPPAGKATVDPWNPDDFGDRR